MKRLVGPASLGLALTLGATPAFADTVTTAPDQPAETRHLRRRSLPRTHDGFYARFSTGPGLFLAQSGTGPDYRHFSGGAAQFQGFIGGTLSRVITVGGAYEHSRVLGLTSRDDIVNGNEPDLSGVRFAVLAVTGFFEVYPDPTRGLHFMGQVGPGFLSTNRRAADPSGWLFALGGGYDWFVADEWSLGVMARVAYGAFSVNELSTGTGTPVDVLVPSIVASATYN